MPFAAHSETLRLATFHAELTRKGPGLMIRDLGAGKDAQVQAVAQILEQVNPDILLMTKVDLDVGGAGLAALQGRFGYAHGMGLMPNTALYVQADMDGDGAIPALGERMSFAPFAGAGGMVLLSRYPITLLRDYSDVLWRDLPGADLPRRPDGSGYFDDTALSTLRLVTQGTWIVRTADTNFVVFQNTTPAFDGPEDRNGKRNRDQLRLVEHILNGTFGVRPEGPLVVMGNTNLDPRSGAGGSAAMAALLTREDLYDAVPSSVPGGTNTAFWEQPGALRVSYILPDLSLPVQRAEVFWPKEGPLSEVAQQASRHRLVWMDIKR